MALFDDEISIRMKLRELIGKPIHLKVEASHTQEQYEIVLL